MYFEDDSSFINRSKNRCQRPFFGQICVGDDPSQIVDGDFDVPPPVESTKPGAP
jgi:hypothetical protein